MANVIGVVIPGIMGSALSRGGVSIWSDNHFQNVKLLVSNPAKLKWDGTRAEAQVIHDVKVSDVVPWPKLSVLGKLKSYLSNHPAFGKPLGAVECAYDWRESLLDSSAGVCRTIEQTVGLHLEQEHVANQPRLVIFSHSMGGLLARVAIAKSLIHPTRIDRVIHIGTPLRGSPAAFRTAYEQSTLPLVREWFSLLHLFQIPKVKRVLLDCFRSFPSLYELFPPRDIKYLQYSELIRRNPLEDDFIPIDKATRANEIHALSVKATKVLASHSIPVYTIYSTTIRTDLEYEVEAIAHPKGYRILQKFSQRKGDGTVPEYSAQGDDTCHGRPVFTAKHAFMCDSDEVVEMIPTMLSVASGGI